MATKAATKHKVILHDPTLPPQAQAAHIALLVLKNTKCNSWEQLAQSPDAQQLVRLTQSQQNIIDTYAHILPMLRSSPIRTIAVCNVCDRFALAPKTGAPTSTCNLTTACMGKLHKVSAAASKVAVAA